MQQQSSTDARSACRRRAAQGMSWRPGPGSKSRTTAASRVVGGGSSMCSWRRDARSQERRDQYLPSSCRPATPGPRRNGARHQQREGRPGPGHGRGRSLLRHPIDCRLRQAGECRLQDYISSTAKRARATSGRSPAGGATWVTRSRFCRPLHPVHRCVRFCREISGTGELMVVRRGAQEEIDVVPDYPLANKLSATCRPLSRGAFATSSSLSPAGMVHAVAPGVCTGARRGARRGSTKPGSRVARPSRENRG